jgi:ParB family chromosome partitioning protein
MFGVTTILIKDIKIKERKRPIDWAKVDSLVKSIEKIGLLQHIVINSHNELVSGLHRIEALKKLGYTEIDATQITGDSLVCELAEIDENLIRNELTTLQRAFQLKRRKQLYEEIHPETIARNLQGHVSNYKSSSGIIPSEDAETNCFTEDTAKQLGVSQSTIQKEISIAEKLSDEAKEILKGTEFENRKVDLLKISRLPEEEQTEIADQLISGQIKHVDQYFYNKEKAESRNEQVKSGIDYDLNGCINDLINVLHAYKTTKSKRCKTLVKLALELIERFG